MAYKYQNPKKQPMGFGQKVYIGFEKPKKLTISNWEFIKPTGTTPIFKCFVIKEDGKEVDKTWAVWNYDLMEQLKKKLKSKRIDMDKVEVEIIRHGDEFEDSFDVK